MRITESRLRQIIREELLREARWRPEDLREGMMIEITIGGQQDALTIWVKVPDGSGGHAGWIEATQRHLTFPCRGAFEVVWSNSIYDGLGPLLYDVAMEVATLLGGGLMSDRDTVSPGARRVWRTYKSSRGDDVEGLRLDSPENEKTPEVEEDNCSVDLAKEENPKGWWEARHPLAQVYRIEGAPTIKRLKDLGRLVVRGSLPGIGV